MNATSTPNPIERRVERLYGEWRAFTRDPAARLLHWIVQPDELKTFEAFFQYENEARETEDLFLEPTPEFETGNQYSIALVNWLVAEFESAKNEMEAAGLDVEWNIPRRGEKQPFPAWMVQVFESFFLHHQPLYQHLAVVLMPPSIGDMKAFAHWMEEVVDALENESVRFIAFDFQELLLLASCARTRAARVRTVIAGLHMNSAYEEISLAAGVATPDGQFRHAYIQMLTSMNDDPARAAERGLAAERIALEHGWLHLAFSVHYALGSGHLGRNDAVNAIAEYRTADGLAQRMIEKGESLGNSLQLRAQVAIGTACFQAKVYDRAARVFEEAAPLAAEAKEKLLLLECWRMAAASHTQRGENDHAWRTGLEALKVGDEMEQRDRDISTLAFAGANMMALTKSRKYAPHGDAIDSQMKKLLGEDWRDLAGPGSPDPNAPHPLAPPPAA